MNIYWGSAVSFIFFMAVGLISARFLNLQGEAWYLFMGIMSTLGLTSSAFFYFIQDKIRNRKAASASSAAAGVTTPAQAGAQSGNEAQQWVKEANLKLAQSKPG